MVWVCVGGEEGGDRGDPHEVSIKHIYLEQLRKVNGPRYTSTLTVTTAAGDIIAVTRGQHNESLSSNKLKTIHYW